MIVIINAFYNFFKPEKLLKNFTAKGELPTSQQIVKRTAEVAGPAVVESFLVALVAFVDNVMVSSLGTYAITAVGITAQPKFLGFAVLISLNVATSALVARRCGEGDREGAVNVLKQVLVIMAVLIALVTIVIVTFAEPLLTLIGAQEDTITYATDYLRIIMGFSFFQLASMTINAAQRGVGNTKIAMKTNMVSNAVNVLFNYLLIGGKFGFPALGTTGAAIATVIGSMAAFGMSVSTILNHNSYLYLGYTDGMKFDKKTIKNIKSLATNTFTEQLFMRIGFFTFAMIVANLGTNAYAAHQIGSNCMQLSFAFGDGLNVAAVSLVGMSLGAKREDLAEMYGAACQRIGFLFSIGLSFMFFFFGETLFGFLSQDTEIIRLGGYITKILAVQVFMQVKQVVTSGCLKGAGDAKFVAMVAFITVTIIRPLASYTLCYPLGIGLIGAWLGILIDQSARCVFSELRFRTGKWAKIKL